MIFPPPDNPPDLFHILHPSDFSETSDSAFFHALRIALAVQGQVYMLHVTPDRASVSWKDFPPVRETLIEWGSLPPGAPREAIGSLGINVQKAVKKNHDVLAGALDYLEEHRVQFLAMGASRDEGLLPGLRKQKATELCRKSGLAALFVPEGARGFVDGKTGGLSLGNILVPATHDPSAQPAVLAASSLCRALEVKDCRFHALYVGEERDIPELEIEAQEQPRWQVLRKEGEEASLILEAAEEVAADLIVMTSAGRQGIVDSLQGSTTEKVLRGSPCALLVVPVA